MLPLFRVNMSLRAADMVSGVLGSGYIGQGSKVDEFEEALRPWVGGDPVTTNSGTAALVLALRLANVRDRIVITTPMTCAATNIAILQEGGFPAWADVDPVTGLIDPVSVRRRIADHGDRVAAVMAVDWAGIPADYDALRAETAPLSIPIIADAAHSLGASYKGRSVGTLADLTAYSFQAIKHLTTGDGGALVATSPEATKLARDLRWFGYDRTDTRYVFRGEQDIEMWGYKSHMNDIAAAIGLANLEGLSLTIAGYRHNARSYDIHLDERFGRTIPVYDHVSSSWMFTVRLADPDEREAFRLHMLSRDIQTSQVHWRSDKLTTFADYQNAYLPGVDEYASRMLCLPTHTGVNEWHVISAANGFYGG